MDEEVIGLNSSWFLDMMLLPVNITHVMTVLAQHSVLAQHLEGAVLTQHRLGEGGCLSSTSQGACAAPCEKKNDTIEKLRAHTDRARGR